MGIIAAGMDAEDRLFAKRQKNLLSSIGFGAREVVISKIPGIGTVHDQELLASL